MSETAPETEAPAADAAPAAPVFGSAFGGGGGAPAAPIFGSSTFGAAGGFTAPAFDASAFGSKPKAADAEGDDDKGDVEAECKAEFKPVVKLEQLDDAQVTTGEENEDILFEAKSKSYRFTDGEWKERGVGPLKLLQHKESKKIRLLHRRDKTLKICANFFVQPEVSVSEHQGSDKARVFTTMDCSDGDEAPIMVNMCVKFGSVEKAELFQEEFEKAQKVMEEIAKTEGAESKEEEEKAAADVDALADKVAETKVESEEAA